MPAAHAGVRWSPAGNSLPYELRTSMRSLLPVFILCLLTTETFAQSPEAQPTTAPTTEPATQPTSRPFRRLGVRVQDLSQRPDGEDQVGIFGGNLWVDHTIEGSRAEQLGLRRGDIIKRINGVEVNNVPDMLTAIRAADTVTVDIIRNGKPLKLPGPTTRP